MYEVDGDHIRIWLPATLEKGVRRGSAAPSEFTGVGHHAKLRTQRVIDGPASVPAPDMQGETVMPIGLDLNYFARHGIINWDHGKGPGDFIGRPWRWHVNADRFHLWAYLLEGTKKADEAWELFDNGVEMAWSIEGKATERDEDDKQIVRRALVVNVALTPNPVCVPTWARKTDPGSFANFDSEFLLNKGLSTSSGGVLIPQSLEGAPRAGVLQQHICRVTGSDGAEPCDCINGSGEAARFINGYRGALRHFFNCCGAPMEIATEMAGKHTNLARITGRHLKGED